MIGDKPLTEYVPLTRVSGKEDVITQWSMGDVEDAGLLKMDFLGLRNLTILRRAVMVVVSEPPVRVGPAVKMMIFSIVVLDAALALAVAPVTAALGILALLVPAFLFGKLIYST